MVEIKFWISIGLLYIPVMRPDIFVPPGKQLRYAGETPARPGDNSSEYEVIGGIRIDDGKPRSLKKEEEPA